MGDNALWPSPRSSGCGSTNPDPLRNGVTNSLDLLPVDNDRVRLDDGFATRLGFRNPSASTDSSFSLAVPRSLWDPDGGDVKRELSCSSLVPSLPLATDTPAEGSALRWFVFVCPFATVPSVSESDSRALGSGA